MNYLIKPQSRFSMLSDLQHEINRLLQPAYWFGQENRSHNLSVTDWMPAIDVKDEGSQYVIHADVPGVDSKNIEVNIENGVLSIKGKKESEHKEKTDNYVCVERNCGSFYRSLSLPETVDSTKISAKNKNGVLTITIPKSKNATAQKIPVEG